MPLAIWAGQLPVSTVYGAPIAEPDTIPTVPDYVTGYDRP
jgi:hypothetical protein